MLSWADLRTGGAPVLQKPADFGWQDQLWPSSEGVDRVPGVDYGLAECLR